MKYIKKFEELRNYNQYWKISLTSPEYEISINKVIEDEKNKKNYSNSLVLLRGLYPDSKYFYLEEDNEVFRTYHHSKKPFDHSVFQGKVNVTQEEIDQWNMEHDAETYNL